MKELSIEEKAKRYDKAIKMAKSKIKNDKDHVLYEDDIIEIFPEIKESKDKKMIQYFKDLAPFDKADKLYEKYGFSHKDAIAWLEKQGGHAKFINGIQVGDKVTRNEDGVLVNLSQLNRVAKKQGEQKPADKVEPKFHEGDWIIHQGTENIYQVVAVIDNQYQLKYGDNYTVQNCADVDRYARLYDVTKDAKAGDILYTQKGLGVEGIFLVSGWQQIEGIGKTLCSNIGYRVDDGEIVKGGLGAIWWKGVKDLVFPATKEQRDTLMKAMTDAGYTFDFEKKELKKIGQKYAWSEEDISKIDRLIMYFKGKDNKEFTEWFSLLKDRVIPQPKQEWSEEDEKMFKSLKTLLNKASCYSCTEGVDKILAWLKQKIGR